MRNLECEVLQRLVLKNIKMFFGSSLFLASCVLVLESQKKSPNVCDFCGKTVEESFFFSLFSHNIKLQNIKMSSPSKTHAGFQSAVGTVKEAIGNVINNDDLKRDGQNDQAEAKAEHKEKQAQEKSESVKDSVKGTAKDVAGTVFGDDELKGEGKAAKAKADVKDAQSKV